MKTSFYFVLWILIYPILGLFNNSLIYNNSFIVALVIVWGLSWLLNRLMPDTLTYERVSQVAPILEDIYTGNVLSFKKRLSREATIETITAVYFLVTTVVIAWAIFKVGVNDWIALGIFGFFTYGAIARSVALLSAKSKMKSNPTPEQCIEIADDTYKLDYASYYDAHNGISYNEMLPQKPKYFVVFKVFSIVFAIIASLLGLCYIAAGIITMLSYTTFGESALAGMYFLYGSLATYFGMKDFISCVNTKTNKTKN